ncbi:AraC family transcriptional regulator [Mucilaginibacter sp. CSA2-8R]|uniref:AraC family transcriptional regulator n=1 Tax=Mucilaginibacter sp. CSA2-8R TaxID=3141542 RepID=UPI00315DD638
MKPIPVHILKERTDQGVILKRFESSVRYNEHIKHQEAHRDDHYIFFLLEKGSASLMIDFETMHLPGGSIYYVLPSQVHQPLHSNVADGWFIAVDTALIHAQCRKVFEGNLLLQQPVCPDVAQVKQLNELLLLLQFKCEEEKNGTLGTLAWHSLLTSFLATVAGHYERCLGLEIKSSRATQITAQFRTLLTAEIRTLKSPAAFAERLNVSEAYLSEALKKATGFTALYWIQQEVMMEAKRLLYYSPLTVKEIAHQLGYTDHSYFSRLFRKVAGVPANEFRVQNRK